MTRPWCLGLLATIAACSAAPALSPVRFVNAPPVTVVDDREDVPRPIANTPFYPELYLFDSSVEYRTTRGLRLETAGRALGVNALDEVPDSTWFTNRIGVRALSPDEIAIGPATMDGPEHHLPWTIVSSKPGGTVLGWVIRDARGVKYLLKPEAKSEPPELETGTHVVVNRLLWACGYNVPDDRVVYIRRGDLVVGRDAVVKDPFGHDQRHYRVEDLDHDLRAFRFEADGRLRLLASRWLPGEVTYALDHGVRKDDPNDRIARERRRDLRGASPIFAWLDHDDANVGNFLDVRMADPADPQRHYLVHYAIDFGKALGAMNDINLDHRRGYSYEIDVPKMLASLFTLGIAPRAWSDLASTSIRGVARNFDVASYDPGGWRPDMPYTPFVAADRFDSFWGARIIAQFTRAQILAAVQAGQFTDPRAVAYLTDTLVARARVTVAYWFARVNPLDHFALALDPAGVSLCFDDLAITAGLAAASTTHYALADYDRRARSLGVASIVAATTGRTCGAVAMPADDDGYTIVRIATARPGLAAETFVHLARDPQLHTPRIIGVWRQ